MEKISVIVPVYNVERYLRQCVDSIINQTYANLDIILVDDGSFDNSPSICDEYAEQDNRVRVIHQMNSGAGIARNAGIELALKINGEGYIAFVDSDDYIDAEMLDKLLQLSKENDADIAECSLVLFADNYINGKAISKEIRMFSPKEAVNAIIKNQDFWANFPTSHVAHALYNACLFNDCRFQKANSAEDLAMKCDLCMRANKIVRINYGYYYYRIMENSLSRGEYSLGKTDDVRMWKYVARRIKESDIDDELSKYVFSIYYGQLLNHYENCFARRTNIDFLCMANNFKEELKREYHNIMNNPYVGNKWQYSIFLASPAIWRLIKCVYRMWNLKA